MNMIPTVSRSADGTNFRRALFLVTAGLVFLDALPARGQNAPAGLAEPPSAPTDSAKVAREKEARQWMTRGAELRTENRFREAVAAYSRAIELLPNYAAAYDDRGNALRQLHDFPAARSDYDQALRLNPKNGVAYCNRALLFREMGDQQAYEADIRASAALGVPRAQALLAMLADHKKISAPVEPLPVPSGPVNPPAAATVSWTGIWTVSNDWGSFSLAQQGSWITGQIIGGWAQGSIAGDASGAELHAQFQREGRTHVDGQVLLKMAPDGNSFTGQWKWAESSVYAASTFNGTRSSSKPDVPDRLAANAASLAGTWHGVASTVGTIMINPDGTYVYNGNPGGSCHATAAGVDFEGNLAAWGGGHATLKNGNLEFYWTNPNGGINWFAFAK